jgi:hypothetical protein
MSYFRKRMKRKITLHQSVYFSDPYSLETPSMIWISGVEIWMAWMPREEELRHANIAWKAARKKKTCKLSTWEVRLKDELASKTNY